MPSCAERCRGSWWSGSVVQRILCSFALCKCRIIAAVKDAMPHQSDMHCNRSETPSEVPRTKHCLLLLLFLSLFFLCRICCLAASSGPLCTKLCRKKQRHNENNNKALETNVFSKFNISCFCENNQRKVRCAVRRNRQGVAGGRRGGGEGEAVVGSVPNISQGAGGVC